MRKSALSTVAIASILAVSGAIGARSAHAGDQASNVEFGKKTAFTRKKGNCLACHYIAGGTAPGDIGPPLISMKARFPDRAKLRAQVWDATSNNPNTRMPPFGKHKILTEKEIDAVVDFLYTL